MVEDEVIAGINKVVSEYFEKTPEEEAVAVKELMPQFIQAGIFVTDLKKGLPIRKVLRALDEQNDLAKVPCIHAERKDKSTFWYFVKPGHTYVSAAPNDTGFSKKQKLRINSATSDQHYVLSLCDELLKEKALRKHRFDFLLGDFHRDGRTRSPLPVDAYYRNCNLVIQLLEPLERTDESQRRTRSGISLGEQRKIYEERRRSLIKKKDINLLEIAYSSFECDTENKLVRSKKKDLSVLNTLLKEYL